MACDHQWQFQSVVYWPGLERLPGSDARPMWYGDRYFCQKCLETKIVNQRAIGNDYRPPLPGTFPK